MAEIEEVPVVRVDYRDLSPICNYCSAAPKVIRITHLLDGEIMVSAMCLRHARGEQDACTRDLTNIPGTGTYLNLDATKRAMDEISEEEKEGSKVSKLLEVLANVTKDAP